MHYINKTLYLATKLYFWYWDEDRRHKASMILTGHFFYKQTNKTYEEYKTVINQIEYILLTGMQISRDFIDLSKLLIHLRSNENLETLVKSYKYLGLI